jgi:predicted nucleic acid-binding protein
MTMDPQEYERTENYDVREALQVVHAALDDKGLLTGMQSRYWYSVWDYLVLELAPEMNDE